MKRFKRVLVLFECIVIMLAGASEYNPQKVSAQMTNGLRQRPVNISVVVYNFDDVFISLFRQSLEEIQKQNEGKVVFKFFDGKGNQAIQSQVIDEIMKRETPDILLVNLVNIQATQEVLNIISGKKDIPVVFFNREPISIDPIKGYKKSFYVGRNSKEAGRLQGEILIDLWNNDRSFIDKNKDGILQYIMLQGERASIESQERTEYSVSTIEKAGIKTNQLATSICSWRRDLARDAINSLLLSYSAQIDAIIANNDEMAIGAIEALQNFGYNKGDKEKTIPVVGVDATVEAQELIKKGYMTGTVIQDPYEMASTSYIVGMNILEGRDPLYGTQYKVDETGVSVRLPYARFIP